MSHGREARRCPLAPIESAVADGVPMVGRWRLVSMSVLRAVCTALCTVPLCAYRNDDPTDVLARSSAGLPESEERADKLSAPGGHFQQPARQIGAQCLPNYRPKWAITRCWMRSISENPRPGGNEISVLLANFPAIATPGRTDGA